jgi:hypothetical protein
MCDVKIFLKDPLVNFINKEVHDAHPPQIIIRAAFTARRMS